MKNDHLGAVADEIPELIIYCKKSGCINPTGGIYRNHTDHSQLYCSEHGGFKIDLLHDQVLVKLLQPERHTHGLYIPDNAKRSAGELWKGIVIAVGPGARTPKKGILVKPDVKPGDVVQFYWMAGKVNVTKFPDQDHRIISESDIQVIYDPEAA